MGEGVLPAIVMTDKCDDAVDLNRLVTVMRTLLGDGGCPWDREQSLTTLKRYVIEEAHEVCDAIDDLGPDASRTALSALPPALSPTDTTVKHLADELGDLLLQVVFQSELARTWGWFGLGTVIEAICNKLERRHPHVFGDATVSSSGEVIANWEKLKLAEKKGKGALEGIPKSLPALLAALRMGDKASRVGFDWPDASGPREKLTEELSELDEAIASGDREAMVHELGDVLFSVVNLARKHGLDPEDSLARANRRFAGRFAVVERNATANGSQLDQHSLEQLEAWWQEAKTLERGDNH